MVVCVCVFQWDWQPRVVPYLTFSLCLSVPPLFYFSVKTILLFCLSHAEFSLAPHPLSFLLPLSLYLSLSLSCSLPPSLPLSLYLTPSISLTLSLHLCDVTVPPTL